MVNGLAVAEGSDWALACDVWTSSERSWLALARWVSSLIQEAPLVIYPSVMGMGKALEILCTNDWLSAEEAYRIGVLKN